MSGILGSFSGLRVLPPSAICRSDLLRLRHRGPDSVGWYQDNHAFLGFRRLAIIDVSGGDQPLYSTLKSAVLTMNGEIYNHHQLRADLIKRHRFRTRSDAEVLVHRYKEQGIDGLLDGINGMFAFALYDQKLRRLVLGRDRSGQKPLYWLFRDGVLRWASELKALLGDERPPLDRQAISEYLRFGYVPAPFTMFAGVYKLPAGCILICEGERAPRVERYWQLTYAPDENQVPTEGETRFWRERCQRLLTDYASILKRHLYLRERLMSIQAKIINASPESYEAIVKQERDNFDATRQRIQELQNDLWQDQLFSAAQNEQQEKEIKKIMPNWGKSSYDSVANCIVDHANRHGFAKNKLKYLRKAAHFNKKRAKKAYPDPGAIRWNKGNKEYLIERDGKIVSYCLNC